MLSLQVIERKIRRYVLKPATQRELSLFTLSCVAYGYTKLLRGMIGISAQAVGGLGRDDWWHMMLNERAIAAATQKLIRRHARTLQKDIFIPTQQLLKILRKRITASAPLATRKSKQFLCVIADLHPRYMACIGVYNCFWRFIGDGTKVKGLLTKRQIANISRERNVIAEFYPKVEKWIRKTGVLRYCTHAEILACDFSKARARVGKKYFYLYTESDNREYVVTNPAIVGAIEKKYYAVNARDMREVHGQPAYRGVVRGTVLNATVIASPSTGSGEKRKQLRNMILVTSMTHPSDIMLVRKAKAIVTDEGGILCHAAIVSREMKKPCIIGTKVATKVFKNGDHVEVDAEVGIVRRVSS